MRLKIQQDGDENRGDFSCVAPLLFVNKQIRDALPEMRQRALNCICNQVINSFRSSTFSDCLL